MEKILEKKIEKKKLIFSKLPSILAKQPIRREISQLVVSDDTKSILERITLMERRILSAISKPIPNFPIPRPELMMKSDIDYDGGGGGEYWYSASEMLTGDELYVAGPFSSYAEAEADYRDCKAVWEANGIKTDAYFGNAAHMP